MAAALTWADFWSLYNSSSKSNQDDLLVQINITRLAKSLSMRAQLEVFEFAPKAILKQISSLLHVKTRKKLGLEQVENEDVLRMLL